MGIGSIDYRASMLFGWILAVVLLYCERAEGFGARGLIHHGSRELLRGWPVLETNLYPHCPMQLSSSSTEDTFETKSKALNRTKVKIKSSAKQKKKKEEGSLMKFDERITAWKLSDSFNSSTLRILFDIKEEVESFWLKFENQIESFKLIVVSKVERDIRTTLGAGDFVTRSFKTGTFDLTKGIGDSTIKPLSQLPGRIKELSSKKDSPLNLVLSGLNPLEDKSRLLGNFDATTTKQRLNKLRKKKASPKGLPMTGGLGVSYQVMY